MSENRPFVLSIAGYDPIGGAGVLADVKTFEQHQVTGFAITTANTIQTENMFYEILWIDLNFVIRSIETLILTYNINVVKIGIVPDLPYLNRILKSIKLSSPATQIVWDPVLKSSTNFDFTEIDNDILLNEILSRIDLITPNYDEIMILFPDFISEKTWINNDLSTAILLKGGHNEIDLGTDYLFEKGNILKLKPNGNNLKTKHGSGCVLSSAIAANLALGYDIKTACLEAKLYIEKYLGSSSSLIGYHYV
jgi:hydroxymethylpyrimidine/phosphomethylpyrimidine kinase